MQLIKDEVVVVAKQDDDAWWTGYGRNGRSGCFPASHVALLPQVAHGGSYMLAEHDHKVSPQRRASSAQFARVLTFNLHCRCVPCDRSLFTRRRPRTIPNLISNEATQTGFAPASADATTLHSITTNAAAAQATCHVATRLYLVRFKPEKGLGVQRL